MPELLVVARLVRCANEVSVRDEEFISEISLGCGRELTLVLFSKLLEKMGISAFCVLWG
jgi:hypothetical protein